MLIADGSCNVWKAAAHTMFRRRLYRSAGSGCQPCADHASLCLPTWTFRLTRAIARILQGDTASSAVRRIILKKAVPYTDSSFVRALSSNAGSAFRFSATERIPAGLASPRNTRLGSFKRLDRCGSVRFAGSALSISAIIASRQRRARKTTVEPDHFKRPF